MFAILHHPRALARNNACTHKPTHIAVSSSTCDPQTHAVHWTVDDLRSSDPQWIHSERGLIFRLDMVLAESYTEPGSDFDLALFCHFDSF